MAFARWENIAFADGWRSARAFTNAFAMRAAVKDENAAIGV